MVLKFSVRSRSDEVLPALEHQRELLGLPDLSIHRDYYVEVDEPPAPADLERLQAALGDRLTETVVADEPLVAGRMVQVAYKRGIIDNESDSLVELCGLFGIAARGAKVGVTYESSEPALAERVSRHMLNPTIEELHAEEPEYVTLRPFGESAPPKRYDLVTMPEAELLSIGSGEGRNLNLAQMRTLRRLQSELGLPAVNDVLIEAADARWSDHCMHTTWKSLGNLLKRLMAASRAVENPNVVSMFEDNAGVWDFYDGWAIAIKGETHSGPSAVSAYFGQLTKLGGVLRDILGTGLGADPIGVFEYTATGVTADPAPLPERPAPAQIAVETIRAIKEYGNTFGVPMMASHMTFHPAFRAKPFALGGSIGIIPTRDAQRGKPQPGDHLMLIGGLTGNDGIHGASASSAGSEMDAASVQIGAPLEEVKFRQAIIDLRDAGCLRALTDVGGAGLNSAVGEIGDPGGVWLNTALVPLKTRGLPAWRILLSESQERMILAVIPERLQDARRILELHLVRHTVVGRFTRSGRYCVVHLPETSESDVVARAIDALPSDGGTGFDVPYELLEYEPEQVEVEALQPPGRGPGEWPRLDAAAVASLAPRILADPEVASQRHASGQYDTTVMGLTAYGPTAGPHHVPTSYWAGTPVLGSDAAVVFTSAYNPWLFELDPARAARQMFLGAVLRQVLAGVAVRDVCLCDNFYTPHLDPDGNRWLVAMVDELCELIGALGTPVISGKDSSAGSVVTPEGIISVPPSVFLAAVGKVPHRDRLRRNEWTAPGSLLVRIGPDTPATAGTVAARALDLPESDPDAVDIDEYVTFLSHLAGLDGTILSGRPIDSGGLLACLAMGAFASGLGAQVDSGDGSLDWLLHEHRCGAVVEVSEDELENLPPELHPHVIGRVTAEALSVRVGSTEMARPAVDAWAQSWAALIE